MPRSFKPDPAAQMRAKALVRSAAQRVSLHMQGDVQKSINIGNALGDNPSNPGEPPHKVTARLFQSITGIAEEDPAEIRMIVGSNVEYAKMLELGTSRMAARPYLRPALQRAKSVAIRALKAALRRA